MHDSRVEQLRHGDIARHQSIGDHQALRVVLANPVDRRGGNPNTVFRVGLHDLTAENVFRLGYSCFG